ncbi:SDR family NAD(P)-dependent oxidoreductase [Streptomyces sp. NPDC058206]|uniref:SDR family NAD(P)-dependent oxidoreductase n=1 Tax=Streptomyces sp. NPDC058206 TaxID=3346382 RepID=UPI0036ECB804
MVSGGPFLGLLFSFAPALHAPQPQHVVTLINAFLPLIRAAEAGRIVNLTSKRGSLGEEGAWVGQPSLPYSSSKAALNAVTAHFARELADSPIKITVLHPAMSPPISTTSAVLAPLNKAPPSQSSWPPPAPAVRSTKATPASPGDAETGVVNRSRAGERPERRWGIKKPHERPIAAGSGPAPPRLSCRGGVRFRETSAADGQWNGPATRCRQGAAGSDSGPDGG